jgi:glutaminyl-tRNA synthetase
MAPTDRAPDFIRTTVQEQLAAGKWGGQVVTRFPPEPNGYLHIGHAKAICLDFGLPAQFGGRCHLRFDDTNPTKEEQEYVDMIIDDIRWLGFDWGKHLYFASDYFEQLYQWAVKLIQEGKAYVDDLSADEIRDHRGTLTQPGKPSPYRNRSVAENLDLFARMRAGEFEDGTKTLRAKIDMASPNVNLRDPVMYRIRKTAHHRTGDQWCIYPMYDWAHGQSDSIEGVTHSLCTMEYEDHRPLYDWYIEQLGIHHPQQIEFARLNLSNTVVSKRKLLQLVNEKIVSGWDDPRMPTLRGMRRRGYTPEAIRDFCDRVGVGKTQNVMELALLEHCVREDLNKRAPRVMAILHPLKVIIDNYPMDQVEELDAVNNPEDATAGTRKVPFARELWIEQADFMETPSKKYFRLAPGTEVRLRWAYIIKCVSVVKDANGNVTEVHCTYDPTTLSANPTDRKIKGTIHWVSAQHALPAEARLYETLFPSNKPDEDEDWKSKINPNSLVRLMNCFVEPALANATAGAHYQFERTGYFCVDPDSKPGQPVFNRTVSLRDTWGKIEKQDGS